MTKPLIVGTQNKKKRIEILQILGDLGLEIQDLSAYPDAPSVVEDGQTFAENAAKKATELARHLNAWVLGEDSGLVVPALDGRPGIYSARYAGTQGDDAANNQKLLADLATVPDDRRGAYYICTAAVADPTGAIRARAEGRCHGVILRQSRGEGGFGYDGMFLVREYHKTFGELSARVKNALSHRARALTLLRAELRGLMAEMS